MPGSSARRRAAVIASARPEAVDFGRRLAARHESPQQGQKECLAEAAERRRRLQVEGLADDVSIVLVEDKPEADVGIEACPALFDGRNLGREPGRFRLLGRDGKEQDQITVGTGEPNPDGDGARLSPFPVHTERSC